MRIKIGDEIKTKHGIKGICTGILIRETGREYQISYFVDGELKSSWIYECEVFTINEEKKFGFAGEQK